MAELKITAIIPQDEDDIRADARKKKAPAAPRKPRDPAAPRTAATIEATEVVDPEKPEFDEKAVTDEVARRYNFSPKKVTELKRSRSGVKAQRTGATRR